MSLEKTKKQLVELLGEAGNDVIALSGKWGTGKTHLWDEVRNDSSDEQVRKALYVSLFGLSTIDQVKRKLMEGALPSAAMGGGRIEVVKNLFKSGVTAAAAHYKALAAINDLNLLLMAPLALRSRVIVIDDIERKCRIPDDCIDPKRYPLFIARAVLQELIESLQSTQEVTPC